MKTRWFSKIVLGLLVAATGVGAGDLITASLAGSNLGLVILWAAVAGAGLLPIADPHTSKIVWGCIHSAVGLAIVWAGGFKAFEAVMSVLAGLMVVTVLLTVILISPDWNGVIRGLTIPTVPRHGAGWLLALAVLPLNNRIRLVGRDFKNGWFINLMPALTLAFFSYIGLRELIAFLSGR
jgi:hypothetical protein